MVQVVHKGAVAVQIVRGALLGWRSVHVRVPVVEVVVDLAALGRVDVQLVECVGVDPAHLRCFLGGRGLAADGCAEQGYLVFLADLTVGVLHDVVRVGVDAEEPGDLSFDAGLLAALAHRALGRGLAEILRSARQRPLPGVRAPLQQDLSVAIDDQQVAGRYQRVRAGRIRVAVMLDPAHAITVLILDPCRPGRRPGRRPAYALCVTRSTIVRSPPVRLPEATRPGLHLSWGRPLVPATVKPATPAGAPASTGLPVAARLHTVAAPGRTRFTPCP